MKVLVDTSVWSLALRRRAPAHPVGDATAAPITLILNWHPPANK